jgi:hypothetical protein
VPFEQDVLSDRDLEKENDNAGSYAHFHLSFTIGNPQRRQASHQTVSHGSVHRASIATRGTWYQIGARQTTVVGSGHAPEGRNRAGQRRVRGKPGRAEYLIFPFRADTEAVQRIGRDAELYHSVIAASADFGRAV